MSDWQRPETLLEIALDALRREVLPVLEGEHRYTALMVANAMAIARRQCLSAAGDDADAMATRDELERRLDTDRSATADASSPADLSGRLVDAIRSGAADPGAPLHEPLLAYLVDRARGELELSNPRYLERGR